MPLGRFSVRNEYGLGGKELYKEGVESEDPKAVLDGVAVAGLVGLLRQLGDLSQFAAEIFHGLQEQVASTVSRSRKLGTRLQRVEASLPSLEKAILSQTSHIHFAYSPGSEWHPHIKNGQNHFICDDLPHFIMDSYEECHEPPRLQLLDRFDTGGPGACLKRYSDPTFFRRASATSGLRNKDKSLRERKARKVKRRRSWQRSGHIPNRVPTVNNKERVQTSSQTGREEPPLSQTGSTFDRSSISDLEDRLDSVGSKIATQPYKTKNNDLFSSVDENMASETKYPNKHFAVAGKGVQGGFPTDTTGPPCSDVTWDEKLDIMEHLGLNYGIENVQNSPEANYYLQRNDLKPVSVENIDQIDNLLENRSIIKPEADQQSTKGKFIDSTGLNYTRELDFKTDPKISQVEDLSEVSAVEGKLIESNVVDNFDKLEGLAEHGSSSESNAEEKYPSTVLDWEMELSEKDSEIDEVQDLDESNYDFHEHDSVQINPESNFYEGEDTNHGTEMVLANLECFPQVAGFPEGENFLKLIADGKIVSESFDSKLRIGDVQYMLETIENDKWAIETIKEEHVAEFSKGETSHESIANDNFVSELADDKLEEYDVPVNTYTKEVSNANLIEWALHDDIDSETDNFVDALNTIDSESESENESQVRKQVEPSASKYEPPKNASNDMMVDTTNQSAMENESHSRTHCRRDDVCDGLEEPNSPSSPSNLEYLENSVSSYLSEAATSQEQQCPPILPTVSRDVESSASKHILPGNASIDLMVDNISQSEFEQESHSRRHSSEVCDALEGATATSSRSNHQLEAENIQEQDVLSAPSLSTVSQGRDVCFNSDEIRLEPHFSGEMPLRSRSSLPHAFWTNGTLFGLQPSKPTVNGISNSAPMGSVNGSIIDPLSSKVDDSGRTMSSSVKIYDHDKRNKSDDSAISAHDGGHVTVPQRKVPSIADFKNVYSETTTSTSEERSSLLSLLGRNLMKSSVRRISASLDYNEKKKPNYPLPNPVPQSTINGNFQSSVNSPPPSPPLDLMKISFQPIDGFETSKLKLKYPEGIDNHAMTVESFPSFQLVPESTSMQHDLGLDSDDDTFCRSYPCMSDDNMTHLSDSDSERWETGDSLESNDHSFYDGLRRISSIESASSSSQHDEIDKTSIDVGSRSLKDVHSMSGLTSQLPTLGTNNNFDFQDFTAQLPPLPPLQWCVSKPVVDEQGYEGLNQSFHTQLSCSTISHHGVDDSAKPQSRTDVSNKILKYEKVGEAKVHDLKQNFPTADGKTVDDRDDFLHQIRNKSFNLKRTEAARSLSTPSLSPSNKLTAILKKASAIRQAVASDDDNWSDT